MAESSLLGVSIAAWQLEDTLRDRFVEVYPLDPEARKTFFESARADGHYRRALLLLVMVSVLEVPSWCRGAAEALFAPVDPSTMCVMPGVHQDEHLLSNVPYLPPGWALILELCVAVVILRKTNLDYRLQSKYFAPLNVQYISLRTIKVMLALVIFEVADCLMFAVYRHGFRLAFISRTGYLWLLPGVQSLIACFMAVIGEFLSISIFLVSAIVFFAWVVVCIFKDMGTDDFNGAPANKGLDTFTHSIDTMFVSGITDDFLARFLPTYSTYRWTGLLWLTFLVIVHVLLLSLVLDTLVSAYMEYEEKHAKHTKHDKVNAMMNAYQTLADATECEGEKLSQDAFVSFTTEFSKSPNYNPICESMARDMFGVVDKQGTGYIGKKGFQDLCKLMEYRLWTTDKDSSVKDLYPEVWASSSFQWFKEQVDGEQKNFDTFMNMVLFTNLGLVIVETVYDLNDWQETPLMENLELMFGFVYLTEVCSRLCVYSWQEYWSFGSNRFDFFTTFALLGSSIFEVVLSESGNAANLKRYMNILRLLRLLRMVKQIKRMTSVQFMVNTVIKLMLGSREILLALGVVTFFFTSLSVQLWGGLLYEKNPELEGTEWKESKWFVLNFNDFLMAFGVWVVTLLCEYVPPFTEAIWKVSTIPGCWLIFPFFYVFGVMIVFELVKAFTIEMFLYLSNRRRKEELHGVTEFEPLVNLEKEFEKRGVGFHYTYYGVEEEDSEEEEGSEHSGSGKGKH